MSFRFAARALLELGKELISSDEVALYELIKNAYDAKSPQVEIVARVVLPYSAYSLALEQLEEGREPENVTKDVMNALDRRSRCRSAMPSSGGSDAWIGSLTDTRAPFAPPTGV